MNALQTLEARIHQRFPSAKTVIDLASMPAGPSFLDVTFNDQRLVVEWRPERGFGLTSKRAAAYGEGAEELIADLETAVERVIQLLLANAATTRPREVSRRERRSAVTARENLRIGTLREVIRAMGGELVLRAKFPDGERELHFDTEGTTIT